MTIIPIPLRLRVLAYLVGLLLSAFGSATVAYLLSERVVSPMTAAYVVAVIGAVSVIAHTFALSHLSIPDAGVELPPATLVGPTVSYGSGVLTVDQGAAAATEARDRDGDTATDTGATSSAIASLSSGVQ